MESIHLNDEIKVSLTDLGKRVMDNYYESINLVSPALAVKLHGKTHDQDGYYHFLLWEFITIFGNRIYHGAANVIDPLRLYLVKRNVTE